MNFKYDENGIKIFDNGGKPLVNLVFIAGNLYLQDVKRKRMIDVMTQLNNHISLISKISDIDRTIKLVEPTNAVIDKIKNDAVIKLNYKRYKNFKIKHGGGNLHLASPSGSLQEGKEGRFIIHSQGFERTITFGDKYLLPQNFSKTLHKEIGISIFKYIVVNGLICIEYVNHYPIP